VSKAYRRKQRRAEDPNVATHRRLQLIIKELLFLLYACKRGASTVAPILLSHEGIHVKVFKNKYLCFVYLFGSVYMYLVHIYIYILRT
jgi:hypothetical protein